MVTGALPFDAEYQGDLLLKHMFEPPIPPKSRLPEMSDEMNEVILRSLAKDPNQRFRDAFHMVAELRRIQEILSARSGVAPSPRPAPISQSPRQLLSTDPEPARGFMPPLVEVGTGPGAAHAWAAYIDQLRNRLRESSPNIQIVSQFDAQLDRMDRVADSMRERCDHVEQLKTRLLALEAKGRDFRTTIGRAIDAIAEDLSVKAQERDAIASERDVVESERERLASLARGGARAAAGEADGLLWQIAASEELLRATVTQCEDLEYQLRELGRQLERLSESLEADQNAIVTQLRAALDDIARQDEDLRAVATSMFAPAG